ncbi:MAG: glycosyltransferase family 2 protein [Candidatus Latescibacterota bacterium]
MTVLFFISISFVLYTYAFYPLLLAAWGGLFPKRIVARYQQVPVSVVLAVRNEEDHIKERIVNLLQQDYPPDLVELIVVSDGSTDRTVELAREAGNERVKIHCVKDAQGKAAAITLGVKQASHDIIVFADARQRFAANVLAELTAVFCDATVGAASGELVFMKGEGGDVREGVSLYWRYEKFIRRMESGIDSVAGVTGSIYAARKELIIPLPSHTLLDDLLIPMHIVLRGFRVVFIRSAKAYDRVSATTSGEFTRKVRTLTGNFQAIALQPALLNPLKNRIFFQFVSHKVMRLLVPYFCLAALISNIVLSGPYFRAVLAAQLFFYGMMILGFTPLKRARAGGIIRIAWTFGVLNAAAVAGLFVFLLGKEKHVWKAQETSGVSGGPRSSRDNGS